MNPTSPNDRITRSAVLALLFALALVFASTVQLIYRFTLPTDGWSVNTTELDSPDWIYDRDLVGSPSNLEPGDELLEVGNRSVRGIASNQPVAAPENWVAGQTIQMTVLRNQRKITLEIPVVHWTLRAWQRNNISDLEHLVTFLAVIILPGIGLFTFIKRPNVPSAQALLMLCSSILANTISSSLPDGLSVQFNSLAFIATGFFSYIIFGTVLAPSLLAFTLLFPRPKGIIERHPWLGLFPYGVGLIILIELITGASGSYGWLGTMGMILVSILSLVHSGFTQRDAVSRAQLRWTLGGIVFGLGLASMTFPAAFGWISNPLLAQLMGEGVLIGFIVIGISLSIAILRYRLYDIDIIIRRTLVYSLLTAILALVYFGGVTLLQSLLSGITGEQSTAAIVLSTLTIAALFSPLRKRMQEFIDHRFYRRKYDAEKTLATFAAHLREDVDLDGLNLHLASVVKDTIHPESVSIYLLRPTSSSVVGNPNTLPYEHRS
jgi:hypothetical protein